MRYHSTRNELVNSSFAQAVKRALAKDGGLYVPEDFPQLDPQLFLNASYDELVLAVLEAFVPELDEAALKTAILENYNDFPIKLVETGSGNFLELYHGPTGAFKDVALTMLPRLDSLTGGGDKIYVTATSGDTGKAALEAFRDQPGVKILVFYPEEGVSHLQKLQMQTQDGENVRVIAIKGNFDDAQRGVKAILQEFSGQGVSSCNSINIARLLTQIPYYWYAATQFKKTGLSYVVPSGNFGDILAGWYAKAMGLPVGKLIVATNENRVLEEFIMTGRYDRQRDLIKTSSPSMDILVSSNVERLLYHLVGDRQTNQCMVDLMQRGYYEIDPSLLEDFSAQSATEAEMKAAIRGLYETEGYIMDPHTACAWVAWDKLGRPSDHIILSTASPFKFPLIIEQALTGSGSDEAQALSYLSDLSPVHPALAGIFERPIRHTLSVQPENMREEFIRFAGGN